MNMLRMNNPKVVAMIEAMELDGYELGRWDYEEISEEPVFRTKGNTLKEVCEDGVALQYASDATVKLVLTMLGASPVARRVLTKTETSSLVRAEGIVE